MSTGYEIVTHTIDLPEQPWVPYGEPTPIVSETVQAPAGKRFVNTTEGLAGLSQDGSAYTVSVRLGGPAFEGDPPIPASQHTIRLVAVDA